MLALPIPMIVALVMGFLFLYTLLAGGYPKLFSALLFFCALQGVVISLVQYYGATALLPLQPVMATIIPPIAWLAFQSSAIRAVDLRTDPLHFAVPVFTAFCVLFARVTLDIVVPGIFLAYGIAILVTLWRSAGGLPLVRLETGRVPGLIWCAVGSALILSAASDTLIALAVALDMRPLQPWIVSILSSVALLSIGLLIVSKDLLGELDPVAPEPESSAPRDSAEDDALMQRLSRLMGDEQLYLDPDLTLARLARRLHVPIKGLSVTINRRTGENVSRFINNFRIAHACERLTAGDNVTVSMLASGFNTKSNFNREFTRVTGKAPSAWKAPG